MTNQNGFDKTNKTGENNKSKFNVIKFLAIALTAIAGTTTVLFGPRNDAGENLYEFGSRLADPQYGYIMTIVDESHVYLKDKEVARIYQITKAFPQIKPLRIIKKVDSNITTFYIDSEADLANTNPNLINVFQSHWDMFNLPETVVFTRKKLDEVIIFNTDVATNVGTLPVVGGLTIVVPNDIVELNDYLSDKPENRGG